MKTRPVGAQLFHADGQTDRHDEANSRFRNFANAPKNARQCTILISNIFGYVVLSDYQVIWRRHVKHRRYRAPNEKQVYK
jgi:hypothetical protein